MKKWLAYLGKIAPFALALVPGIPKAAYPVIVAAIEQAEVSGEKGASKKKMVIDIASASLRADSGVAPSKTTLAAVSQGVDIVVGMLDAAHQHAPDEPAAA